MDESFDIKANFGIYNGLEALFLTLTVIPLYFSELFMTSFMFNVKIIYDETLKTL